MIGHLALHSWVLEEFVHSRRDVIGVGQTSSSRDLLVEKVALEDGVGADVEDGNEYRSDHVGKHENHEKGHIW